MRTPVGEMRVYRDPNAVEGVVEILKFKGKPFMEAAAFYAPYIPLNMEVLPDIEECSEGKYRFRLRGGFDCLMPKAERAWLWIEANIPSNRFTQWNGKRDTALNSDLFVEFHDQKDAALFKLMFL